jgi:hypothetical protein
MSARLYRIAGTASARCVGQEVMPMTTKQTISMTLAILGLAACAIDDQDIVRGEEAVTASRSVTGGGTWVEPDEGFNVTATVEAHADGNSVRGTVETQVHLQPVGGPEISFLSDVVCLSFEGNKAWIGAVVRDSRFLPAGTMIIMEIEDGGPGQPDYAHGEAADDLGPGVTCDQHPELAHTPINGNYVIR